MRKHETNPNQETFCQVIDQGFKSIEFRKNTERLRNCHTLEEAKETGQLDAVWGPRFNPGTKDMREKTSQIQMKSVV